MNNDPTGRRSTTFPAATPTSIPHAPPLPTTGPFQRFTNRFLRYPSRPPSPEEDSSTIGRYAQGGVSRLASLGAAQNASASHRTGLTINTLSINESGTHALIGGKEIFKTVKVENGVCVEDLNLRSAIRSTPTQASGGPRQIYTIDIADVAWAKGDTGNYVAAATSSGKIILYDLGHAGLPAAQLHEHYRQVHRVTFNPHRGSLLLSGSQDGTVRLWDVRDARRYASTTQSGTSDDSSRLLSKSTFSGGQDSVRDVKWSPTDGVEFAYGTDGGFVQIWDIRFPKHARLKIPGHPMACTSVDWHPDGKHLASSGLEKMIRVWDISKETTGKRARWEVKTPYPVMNARWRPPCESPVPSDYGARQCTQLVAAYDRKHPVLHIWDLRRPLLPFRELTPHLEAPTDLLWHSQDLLWTVGHDGFFLQSDVQHSIKTMDLNCPSFVTISTMGDLTGAVMKTPRGRRSPKRQPTAESATANEHHGQSPDQSALSRSWQDDSIDNHFLSAHPDNKRERSSSNTRQPPGASTPPNASSKDRVVNLDHVFVYRKASPPEQICFTGKLPHPFFFSPEKFEFLAENYTMQIKLPEKDGDLIGAVRAAFEHNQRVALRAGEHNFAKEWKMVCETLCTHLMYRRDGAGALASEPGTIPATSSSETTASVKKPRSASPWESIGLRADVELEVPWIDMKEYLDHLLEGYTGAAHQNGQMAAHLLLLIMPCLPDTNPLAGEARNSAIITAYDALESVGFAEEELPSVAEKCYDHILLAGYQPSQLEVIMSHYHDMLCYRQLHVEAAEIRNLCYPHFPAVYEQALEGTAVSLGCGTCGKPVFPRPEGKIKCESCAEKGREVGRACEYCWQEKSPIVDGPLGVGLRSECLLCGHGGHAACLREFYVGQGERGCFTPGCLCDCTGGLEEEPEK